MIRRHSPALLRLLLLTVLLALAACNKDIALVPVNGTAAATPDYWPTAGWQTAAPEVHGFDAGAFDTLDADAAAALPYYTSLLVIKDGWLVHESYHDTASETGNTADTRHHLWSVTKSVTSLTLGRAWTLGALTNLDASIGDTFGDGAIGNLPADDARRAITLRDALQMRSGLAWNENAWLLNSTAMKDPLLLTIAHMEPACPSDVNQLLCAILQRPLAYAPGTVWNYDTYDTYLVSAFFTAATGQTLADYAGQNLFNTLGITFTPSSDWAELPPGYTFGGALLFLRSRDLARLGMLVLYDGQWDGQQLIAKDWMAQSLAPQGDGQAAAFDGSGEPATPVAEDLRYGWQWWRVTGPGMTGEDSISARGLGGQQMHIFRDKGLIIIITCDSADLVSDRSTAINDFLKTHILDKLAP